MAKAGQPFRFVVQAFFQILLGVLFLHLLDKGVGWGWPEGLCLPPRSHLAVRTSEFSFEARTNDLGFRDKSERWARPKGPLVVTIGDSFTYGWGVADDDAWPRVLERRLGGGAGVANLGVPGAHPLHYADIVERALPALRPDLVLVAVLQGDDLAQPLQEPDVRDRRGALRRAAAVGFRRVAPNLVRVLRNRERTSGQAIRAEEFRAQWKDDARRVLDGLSIESRRRYKALEPEVRSRYERGDLNPWLLWCWTRVPDYYLLTLDLESPRVAGLMDGMTAALGRIATIAARQGVPVVVVSVPHGMYVNERAHRGSQRVGFLTSPQMLGSPAPDVAIARCAASARLPFLTVSNAFAVVRDRADLYFELDGHFTADGHRLFAEQLAPLVRRRLPGLPE